MGALGNISPEGIAAIGIVVGLLSTAIQSLGLTLQRQSHLLEDEKIAPETRKPPYKRPRWQIGMLMFVMSNLIGSTIQITTLPLPVLSTLQAAGLVFNTAFATLLLKEAFTKFSFIGTILTGGGAALIAVFGAIAEPPHSLFQLLILLKGKGFIIWMVMTLVVAAATIVVAHFLKVYSSYKHMSKHLQKTGQPRSNSSSMTAEPRARRLSVTAHLPQLPRPLQVRVKRLKLIRGLCYALVSGILSAHSLLVAKSAVELIVRTVIDHDNQFNKFQSWLILLALLFFALSQLYYLHLGLRLCSTSVLYPFVFCIYNIVAILDGLIYFQQASRLTLVHGILVAVGTVILLSGVLALSWRLDDSTPTEPAPQLVAPQTPLAPGMGIFRHSDEFESSPMVEPLARSSTDPVHSNERTPLLSRPARRTTLTKTTISPGGAAARDIWAELDDDEDTYDFLASLPRNTSPTFPSKQSLEIPKKRRATLPTRGEVPSPIEESKAPQRSSTLSAYIRTSAENAAAMLSSPRPTSDQERKSVLTSSEQRKTSRDRRVTVHFEEENLRTTSPKRSRFDLGLGITNEESGKGKEQKNDQSERKDEDGKKGDPG